MDIALKTISQPHSGKLDMSSIKQTQFSNENNIDRKRFSNLSRSFKCKRTDSHENNKKICLNTDKNDIRLNRSQLEANNQPFVEMKRFSRTGSLPLENLEYIEEVYRLRCFDSSHEGSVINRGDSFKRSFMRKKPNPSLKDKSDTYSLSEIQKEDCKSSNIAEQVDNMGVYSVVILGASCVGKSSFIKQFKTSEYSGTYEIRNAQQSFESESIISIMLDGVESQLKFDIIDISQDKEASILSNDYNAAIVVYSISDRKSFEIAHGTIKKLRDNKIISSPIILVGNKVDLVRKRCVDSQEGRDVALRYATKFIETSLAINEKVDDLLAGVLKQIRLDMDIDYQTAHLQKENNAKNKETKVSKRRKRARLNERCFSKELFFNTLMRKLFRNSPANDVENLFSAPAKFQNSI